VTSGYCVMLGEGTQVDLILGLGPWVLKMFLSTETRSHGIKFESKGEAHHNPILEC
jgi:hypothetical protein